MPTVTVDDRGTAFYYEDTGPPEGSHTYLTVILMHGLLFHGEIFKRLLPHAAVHNLRLVRVNLRDYYGSSPYSDEEIQVLKSGDPSKQSVFFKTSGHQIAALIANLAGDLGLPPATELDGRTVGGVALLTWSMSNTFAMSLLGNASSLSEGTRHNVGKYLRTLFMLDAMTGTTVGARPAQGAYHPFRDASLSMEERLALGSAWLWYYFTRVTELDQVDGSFLASRVALHENPLSRNEAVNESKTPTFLKTSKEEINSFKDVDALVHSGIPILASNLDVFQENFERALFDTEGLFPGVKVVVAWGDESMDDAVWTAKLVNDRVKSEQPEGKVRRNVALYRMEGANHVPHWDHPEMVVKLLTTAV